MQQLNDNIERVIREKYRESEQIVNPTGYFYDLSQIKSNIDLLENFCPPQISLYYAMKANNNPLVMDFICGHSYIKGLEIASSGELEQASKYIDCAKIIFTGPGKTEYELECAIKSGIRFINIESITEAYRIQTIAERLDIDKVDVLVRVNLNYSITDAQEHMSGQSTKMGIDEDVLIESLKVINQLSRVQVRGIHVFAASGVLNYKSLIKSNDYIFNLVEKIEKNGFYISVIDFGGGLGIDYTDENKTFDVQKYCHELATLIERHSFKNKEIIMELGTFIVGNAGYYTSKIIDIKKVKGKKHIVLAGGVNHMGLPLEMRRKHPVAIIEMKQEKLYLTQPGVNDEIADISGPLCMVSDKLCWDEFIEKAEIGDIVVFLQAGAYCYGEGMHAFLSHSLPKEFVI